MARGNWNPDFSFPLLSYAEVKPDIGDIKVEIVHMPDHANVLGYECVTQFR